jgi:hypothetical protein
MVLPWSVINNNTIAFKKYITNIALMQILFMSSSEERETNFDEFGWIFSVWHMATTFRRERLNMINSSQIHLSKNIMSQDKCKVAFIMLRLLLTTLISHEGREYCSCYLIKDYYLLLCFYL